MTEDIIGSAPFPSASSDGLHGGLGSAAISPERWSPHRSSLALVKAYGFWSWPSALRPLIPQLLQAVIPLQRFLYNEWYPHVILYTG